MKPARIVSSWEEARVFLYTWKWIRLLWTGHSCTTGHGSDYYGQGTHVHFGIDQITMDRVLLYNREYIRVLPVLLGIDQITKDSVLMYTGEYIRLL